MAKKKNSAVAREAKRDTWVERTMRWSGYSEARVRDMLSTKRTQSFRVNPLRASAADIDVLRDDGFLKAPIDWCEDGYALGIAAETLSRSRFSGDGKIFVQNAASWLPVIALDPKPGESILDVCAAPGGKASHIQAITNNRSQLICNDNSKPRLMKLQATMERLGAHATYTLHDAAKSSIGWRPIETFDKILLDAPCSGEGLMTLQDMKLFDSWSVAHIRRLSDLQKKILHESWRLLKPGGALVYSTCTMAPEENEAVIDWFLRKHDDSKLFPVNFSFENKFSALSAWNDRPFQHDLSPCLRLTPGKLTEAFFVAKIEKLL